MLFLLAFNPAYYQFLHNLTVHHMIPDNPDCVRWFYLTVSNPVFTRTYHIYQDFFLTHADTTGLFHMHILQLTFRNLIQQSCHDLTSTGSNTASAHTYDYFVINDTVETAVSELDAIMTAEHCKPSERMEIINGR